MQGPRPHLPKKPPYGGIVHRNSTIFALRSAPFGREKNALLPAIFQKFSLALTFSYRGCIQGKTYLVLSQMIQLQSLEGMPMDMTHLPTLFVLDSNLDGKVTLEELVKFATRERTKSFALLCCHVTCC